MSALPHLSDIDLLRYGKRIIDLDSEVTEASADWSRARRSLLTSS
jgi:hypothetical protein